MLSLFLAISLTRPPDLTKPPGGNTRVVRPGGGTVHPTENDFVRIRYVLWHYDGTIEDNYSNQFMIVDVAKMGPEWKRDVTSMVANEERMTWLPEQGKVIDTELMQVIPKPEVPSDVAAPPADAITTPSGLAYKILREGKGKTHPKRGDTVNVQYNAWTADGTLFDSSYVRGESMEIPVDGGIPGWTEGIQLLTSGAKARFWVPERLAYAGIPDKPKGMIVFDIELSIVSSEIMPKRGQRRPLMRPPVP